MGLLNIVLKIVIKYGVQTEIYFASLIDSLYKQNVL